MSKRKILQKTEDVSKRQKMETILQTLDSLGEKMDTILRRFDACESRLHELEQKHRTNVTCSPPRTPPIYDPCSPQPPTKEEKRRTYK